MSYLIEQHLALLRTEGKSPATIRDRGRCLRRLHADLPMGIAYACREQLQAWLSYEKWSRATRYTYTGHVVGFYHWLFAAGDIIDEDPTAGMARPKPPRGVPHPATDEQLALALTAPEPLRLAVVLANWEGMRRAEAAAAHREHITEDLVLIPVAKGGDEQTVPTHPTVWEHVRDRPAGALILDARGRPLGTERLAGLASRWFGRHGFPDGFGLHHFRHRFGTLIQRTYRDIRVTQECMRHRSVASTQIYTQVTNEQRTAAIRQLPGELGPADIRPEPPARAA